MSGYECDLNSESNGLDESGLHLQLIHMITTTKYYSANVMTFNQL